MLQLCLITPLLGSLKNYVKYKRFNFLVFIRTFYIYALIQCIIQTNNIYLILILERWFFFGFKVIRSLILVLIPSNLKFFLFKRLSILA